MHISVTHIEQTGLIVKRVFDAVIALLVLTLSFPALLLIVLLIRLDSKGPIFFVQYRVGRNQEIFPVYKFRTMRTETTDRSGARQVSRDDPRITRVGHFLRRHSLDEVPQFINVLLGTMSIVGPRPHPLGLRIDGMPLEHIENWHLRTAIKPGLTGLAQISGARGALTSIDDAYRRLQYDLKYIQDWSIWKDFTIIARTVAIVIHDEDAF